MDVVDAHIIFATVADLSSISGAARKLGLPKANVSRAVAKLEARYKLPLFDRSNRRLALTEAGHTLREHCDRLRSELVEAEARIALHRGVPTGTLRVGSATDVARMIVAPRLLEFIQRYPDIDLKIRTGDRLLPEANVLDVVLHVGWLADSRLLVRKLAPIPMMLAASAAYVAEHGLPQSPDDLVRHKVIGNFYADPGTRDIGPLPARVPPLELVRGHERHLVPTWSRFTSTDQETIFELVKQGAAIAPVFRGRLRHLIEAGSISQVLPAYEIHDQPALYALYTERLAVFPKLKVFLDHVASAAAEIIT